MVVHALPSSGGLPPGWGGGISLHGMVGVNCEKGTAAENQGAGAEYMG